MKLLFLLLFLLASLCPAQESEPVPGGNINARYTVESVELSRSINKRISRALRKDIDSLIGQHFDPQSVSNLAARIRREVHATVRHRVEKGMQPEHVRIIYDASERRWDQDEAKVTKLAYHQKLGWTGGVQAGFDAGRNRFEFGIESDADTLVERYAGFNIGYARSLGERVRLRFEFESLHQQWNGATQVALLSRSDVPGIYRERLRMDPEIVVLLAPGLSLSAGLSYQLFQTQFPVARFESANAVTTTLRHRKRWEGSDSSAGQEWDAGYSLRAATSLLDSDYAYTRHLLDVRYTMRYARSRFMFRSMAGAVSDRAPLFERFTLGDSHTLRGWNKFDVAPLGGTRSLYGSVQYMYSRLGGFYDAGAVWDRRTPRRARQAAGVVAALNRNREGPYLAVGFPLHSGSVAPLFIIGMNF